MHQQSIALHIVAWMVLEQPGRHLTRLFRSDLKKISKCEPSTNVDHPGQWIPIGFGAFAPPVAMLQSFTAALRLVSSYLLLGVLGGV